jgi:2-iminobutanoate/2-iminopropanoate deaminase
MTGLRSGSGVHIAVAAFCVQALAGAGMACAAEPSVATKPPLEFHAKRNAPPGMSLPFSEAVRAGDMLYLSGEIGTDASGKLVAGGIKAEAKQVMDNIGASLARHGSSFDRVVQCTVALADMAEWPAFNEVYRGYFKDHFPARMAFGANGLALGARVEVQCNALVSAAR